jgi:hypothetical protein
MRAILEKPFNINHLKQQISTDFTTILNLVRDQGVGGSNPLSPTKSFNSLQSASAPESVEPC